MDNLNKYYELLDEPLHVLAEYHMFSVRTYNVFEKYELNTLSLILDYYIKHKRFLKLGHIGKLTNADLTHFCEEVLA